MPIGDTSGEIPENILGLGFNFGDKVKILGFEVSNTVHSSGTKITYKMLRKKSGNWLDFGPGSGSR